MDKKAGIEAEILQRTQELVVAYEQIKKEFDGAVEARKERLAEAGRAAEDADGATEAEQGVDGVAKTGLDGADDGLGGEMKNKEEAEDKEQQ
jgi:hypothetical protein